MMARFKALWQKPAAPKGARLRLEGGMSVEDIERTLGGTKSSPAVKAIEALISTRLVEASDKSNDEPREAVMLPGQVITGFTTEMRTHAAGGAWALANLLQEIQELTASRGVAKGEEKKENVQ